MTLSSYYFSFLILSQALQAKLSRLSGYIQSRRAPASRETPDELPPIILLIQTFHVANLRLRNREILVAILREARVGEIRLTCALDIEVAVHVRIRDAPANQVEEPFTLGGELQVTLPLQGLEGEFPRPSRAIVARDVGLHVEVARGRPVGEFQAARAVRRPLANLVDQAQRLVEVRVQLDYFYKDVVSIYEQKKDKKVATRDVSKRLLLVEISRDYDF